MGTFNLRGCLSLDGMNIWPARRGLVGGILDRHPADVLCFQEMLWPNLRYVRRRLPGFRYHIGNPSGRAVGVYNAIFWRSSAHLRLEESGGFWLAEDSTRRTTSWGAKLPRTATWVRLKSNAGQLLIVNVHLDHVSQTARLEASRLVIARLRAMGWPETPALVLGDFNANPTSPVHAEWLKAGLADSWQSAGHTEDPEAFTFHGFKGRRDPDETRIDWILHDTGLKVTRVEIIKDAAPPRYPSDHYPVFAELTAAPRAPDPAAL